ncbi:MAG: adenylate/guanylate cyclase domain-containing protein [Acidimicrobiia bacterium]
MTLPSGVVTFLFTDVVGSSAKWDLDRSAMEHSMGRHDEILEKAIESGAGHIVKKTGDGFMAVFADPSNAVSAAIESQQGLAAEPWDEAVGDFEVRMGLHTGPAEPKEGDYLGPALNRAARIEAAGHGGQILLSAATRELIGEAKDSVGFRDLGEHYLRGLSRPERLYQVTASSLAADFPPLHTESKPDRPSIAVLPFETIGDPDRSPFADGLVEDLITGLSRCRDLFVIARNSTFVYKGTHVDVGTVAAQLGVRYVLEGSVRWSGDQARITAQLIDGTTGGHLWAKKYDRNVDDVFTVIDEITADIVAHLSGYHGVLVLTEKKRTLAQDPGSLGDYEGYMRGLELKHRFAPDTNREARAVLLDVLERRPAFARAHVAVAWTWLFEVWWGWTETPDASLKEAWRHADEAAKLDDFDAEVHWLLGDLYMIERQYEKTEAEYRRSIELNSSLADVRADWASIATRLGMPDEGVESMELALRLNPNHPVWYAWFHGSSLYGARRYNEAVKALQPAAIHTVVSRLYLAAALSRLGKQDEAEREVETAQSELPGLSIELLEQLETYRAPEDQAHLSDALRSVGLPKS